MHESHIEYVCQTCTIMCEKQVSSHSDMPVEMKKMQDDMNTVRKKLNKFILKAKCWNNILLDSRNVFKNYIKIRWRRNFPCTNNRNIHLCTLWSLAWTQGWVTTTQINTIPLTRAMDYCSNLRKKYLAKTYLITQKPFCL